MKKLDAILFDLDGTLLPMDNNEFAKGYLHLLAKFLEHKGYEEKSFIEAMWSSVAAMVKNGGGATNAEKFWAAFAGFLGERVYDDIQFIDTFYNDEFNKAVSFTQPTRLAAEAVALAHEKADRVVLATNPFFPLVAVRARLRWAGLSESDFDLVTHYENSTYCKPHPAYYTEIARKLALDTGKCLMIGNNTREDIAAAQSVGISTFLVNDNLISEGECPETPSGSFSDLLDFLREI